MHQEEPLIDQLQLAEYARLLDEAREVSLRIRTRLYDLDERYDLSDLLKVSRPRRSEAAGGHNPPPVNTLANGRAHGRLSECAAAHNITPYHQPENGAPADTHG